MYHRRFLIKIVYIFTIGIILSCNISPIAPELAGTADLKVAIVLPRSADDGSWSQSGYEGLQLIAKELKAQVAYTDKMEVPPRKDFQQVFRQYAADGYDFIIGHGGQFQSALEAVAKEFPQTKFAMVGGYSGNNNNLGALGFRADEMGYIMGVVAALKTQTHKVGMIGGLRVADVVDVAKLFERGAKANDPNIQVFINWTNSWTDSEKASQAAEEMVRAGVDTILAYLNETNRAVFAVAAAAGARAIGYPKDQYHLAPDTIITSAIYRISNILLQGAILMRQGRWEGKQYRFGMQEGALDIAPFRGALTPAEEAIVNGVKQDILMGKIDLIQ